MWGPSVHTSGTGSSRPGPSSLESTALSAGPVRISRPLKQFWTPPHPGLWGTLHAHTPHSWGPWSSCLFPAQGSALASWSRALAPHAPLHVHPCAAPAPLSWPLGSLFAGQHRLLPDCLGFPDFTIWDTAVWDQSDQQLHSPPLWPSGPEFSFRGTVPRLRAPSDDHVFSCVSSVKTLLRIQSHPAAH